jgi:hypothetical protein
MIINDIFTEEKVRLDPKCWTGKKIGNPKTKMKGGTRVNNCVPAESVNEMDKSQTPPGRDGSNDLDAGKKEYTAKATTAKKVAKDAKKILNKELNKKQGVAEANIQPTSAASRSHIGNLSNPVTNSVVHPSSGKEIGLITMQPTGEYYAQPSSTALANSQGGTFATKDEAHQFIRNAHAKAIKNGTLSDKWLKKQPLPQFAKGQGMAEGFNGEYDDEAGMAQGNLYTIAKAAKGLLDTIDDRDNLPEWVQEKIAKVEGMLVTSWNYMQSQKAQGIDPQITESICSLTEAEEIFNDFERSVQERGLSEDIYDTITDDEIIAETAAWRRKEGKSKKGGLNAKGVASYRRENPGSKLQMAVTTKPSKLKKGSKAAKRRKSFCARMSGVKGPMKKPNGKPTRKALALRKWNC